MQTVYEVRENEAEKKANKMARKNDLEITLSLMGLQRYAVDRIVMSLAILHWGALGI